MEFKIKSMTTEDEKGVIYITYNGELTEETFTNEVKNAMIEQISTEIFNSNELKIKFFNNDKTFYYLEMLEQVGEVEVDNEYIDLSDKEYLDTLDFVGGDIRELADIAHKEFIKLCLAGDYFDIEGNLDEDEKIITYFI